MTDLYHGPQFTYNVGSRAVTSTGHRQTESRTTFDADAKDTRRHSQRRLFVQPTPIEDAVKHTPASARRMARTARPPPGAQYFTPRRNTNIFVSTRAQAASSELPISAPIGGAVKSEAAYADIEYYPTAVPRRAWAMRQTRATDASLNAFNYRRTMDELLIQNTKRGIGYFIPRVIRRD